MLPKSFNAQGVLPHDFSVTFRDLRESLLVRGPETLKTAWDAAWRATLVDNLEILARQLWGAGISVIYINGSFVQNKPHPADIDGCFECDFTDWNSGALEKKLNERAAKKVWVWGEESRRLVLGERRLPMWASYRVELYPYFTEFPMGIETNDGFLPFPEAFRALKSGYGSKGILKLVHD